MGTGISNYGGSYTNPSALSVYFTNPVWKPAGQWCSVKLVVTGKAAGTSTVTFKLAGTRSLSKSITVNVVNNSNSLVDANLSKISYIKQGYDTCKASSAAMGKPLLLPTKQTVISAVLQSRKMQLMQRSLTVLR